MKLHHRHSPFINFTVLSPYPLQVNVLTGFPTTLFLHVFDLGVRVFTQTQIYQSGKTGMWYKEENRRRKKTKN